MTEFLIKEFNEFFIVKMFPDKEMELAITFLNEIKKFEKEN
jgi:hypothetical protein